VPRSLDLIVIASAAKLVAAHAGNAAEVYHSVLADLVDQFGADVSFLHHTDHEVGGFKLVAEWPPGTDEPNSHRLDIRRFTDIDPVFAFTGDRTEPAVIRPTPGSDDNRPQIDEGRQVGAASMVAAPLVAAGITTGVLVIVTCDDREWTPEELAALELIASLLAQIQARTGAEERLRYLAEHDELTGLCNRRALITHLDDRLSAGKGGPVSALFFDMDRLKTINDYMGHIAGDSFIRLLAQRLQRALDGDAFVARLGGDEFVVVPAAPMDADTAESLAYRLQSTITESVDIDGEMLSRTASIGVALGIPGRDSTSDLLNRADRAVIMAKRAGGNQVALVSSDTTLNSELRNDVELHLRDAIAGNSLVLHYLPEIDMRNGKILATEALVRWQHPTRGLLPPGSFIEVAESINLAGELGRWVIRRACADFSKWQTQAVGKGIILRVNVSPVQLVTHGFVDDVLDTIDEFGLDRESVCLEITESAVVKDLETTLRTLVSLREVGLRIAIDDFGTGYSVLSGLKMLPVDTLKIDKGFVFELGSNASDLAIVQAIIALANAFGLQVVAEGVETEAAATILLQHGCHRAQGFMLWPPVTAEAMASLLVRGRIPVRFSRNPYN